MAIDGRVGRRALPLVMVLVGGCLGEPITVGRVGVDPDNDRDPPPGLHRNPTYTIAPGAPFDPDEPLECDFDADGHESLVCGGDDCDDRSADVGPDINENEDWDIDLIAEGA
jgi:hypothetical protein